jgi:hypothetical protein
MILNEHLSLLKIIYLLQTKNFGMFPSIHIFPPKPTSSQKKEAVTAWFMFQHQEEYMH